MPRERTEPEDGLDSSSGNSRLMGKGDPLSGLVFPREDTVERCLAGGQRNLYPFMLFVGYAAARGKVRHQTQPPVHVTRG
jgi:hypothetical protein